MAEILWYYAKNDQQLGPLTPTELRKLAESGGLLPADLIWRDGMESWAPASKVKGLFPVEEVREPVPAAPVVSNGPTETIPPDELAAILATPATPVPTGIPVETFFTPTPAASTQPPVATLSSRPIPIANGTAADAPSKADTTFDLLWLGQLILWGICIATVFLGGILFAVELVNAESPAEETSAAVTFFTFFAAAYVIARAGERVAYLVQLHFERRRR